MYWGRILDIVSRFEMKKMTLHLFLPAGQLTVRHHMSHLKYLVNSQGCPCLFH